MEVCSKNSPKRYFSHFCFKSVRRFVFTFLIILIMSAIQLTGFITIASGNEIALTTEEQAWLKAHPDITIAYVGDYPPYSFQNQQGVFKGISVDLINEVARRAGIRLKTYPDGNWENLYSAAQQREVDVVGGILKRPNRNKWFEFTKPYLATSQYIITRKEESDIRHRNDIAGKTFALVKGYATTQSLLEEFPSVKPYYVESVEAAFEAVSLGRASASLGVMGAVQYFIAQNGIQNLKFAAPYSDDITHWRMSVRKDWPLLQSILDKSLASITDEQRQQFFLRWTGDIIANIEVVKSKNDNLLFTNQEKTWLDQDHKVRVRVINIPPYIILNKDAEPEGISIDYLNLISEKTGLKFQYIHSGKTFTEALEGIKTGKNPDLISSMMRTLEREKSILFSKDYYKSPYVLFAHMDFKQFITDTTDLDGLTIALPKGTVIHKKVMEAYPGLNVLLFENDIKAIQAVAAHKADIYIGNLTLASFLILENGLSDVKIVGPTSFGDHVLSMGIRMDWPLLVNIIDKALASISIEDQAKIKNKYISIRYEKVENVFLRKWLPIFGGAAIGILFLFVFLNRSLAKRVKKRTSELENSKKSLESEIKVRESVEKELRDSEERLLALFDNVDDVLYVSDPETYNLLYVNPVARKEWGEDLIGLKCYKALQNKTEPCSFCTNHLIFGDNLGKTHVWQFQKKANKKWYQCVDKAIRWPDGRMVRFEQAIDITENRKLETQLVQVQKLESIGTLAGGIAHDFNNILSAILGFTELAISNAKSDPLVVEDLNEVYLAGIRAKELVQQILAFARQADAEMHPIQVDIIVREVLKLIRASTPTTIEIMQDIKSDSITIGNTTQIHQIIMNLCTNATHAMDESGGILDVALKDVKIDKSSPISSLGLKSGDYIEIKVSDSGTGVAEDVIDFIFDPYYTTKTQGEGTGLGLSLVHGIVEKNGGKVRVESQLGKGTIFSVYLPITKKRQVQQSFEQEELPRGVERLLFVDDEAPLVKMGGRMFESLGYTVTTRTSSVEALELFRSKPKDFDAIITDMTMPNMAGDALAIELMEIRPDIPIILCTGYSKKISAESALEIGIKAFVYKPFIKKDLAKTVRKVLDEANG